MIENVAIDFATLGIRNPLVQSLGIAVVRSIAGWLENAIEDGKITVPEMKQLAATLFRVMPQAIGLNALMPGAGAGALFTDWIVVKLANAIKKLKSK